MSLYIEASEIISRPKDGSLKSRIYSNSSLKSPPNRLYALIIETLKHQEILNEVIEKSGLLGIEKKLSHPLALLLLHDLLLTKSGIATSTGPLKTSILRHKARLSAEFIRARLRRGYASTGALIAATAALSSNSRLPRWVRVNSIKTSVDQVLKTSFKEYTPVEKIEDLFPKAGEKEEKVVYKDIHIPTLLGFPPSSDFTAHPLYLSGTLILQDKASCFPAYLLSPPENAYVIDGTAAPGNKTTHLAAIVGKNAGGKILAFERDPRRAKILDTMVRKAGANGLVEVKAGEDFLKTQPKKNKELAAVTHILLDPSCSGSGIVSREEYELLAPPTTSAIPSNSSKGKKRKRPEPKEVKLTENTAQEEETKDEKVDIDRLLSLSAFQQKMVLHAMTFPAAKRITYSTCSIHAEENEHVVMAVMGSDIAKRRGWRVEKREDGSLKHWERRGLVDECAGDKDIAEGCIRCNPVKDGGIGFFVVAFSRDGSVDNAACEDGETTGEDDKDNSSQKEVETLEEAEEWKGFSDGEDDPVVEAATEKKEATGQNKKQKKQKKVGPNFRSGGLLGKNVKTKK
ncbi:hypothetical protein RUND412_009557 [Rhizina undulata]